MRKLVLGLTTSTLLLLSCGQNDVSNLVPKDKSLHFSTYVGKQTRAAEFNNTSWVDGNQFAIKAYLENSGWKSYFTDKLLFDGTSKDWALQGPDRFQVPYATKYIAIFPSQESYTDEGVDFTTTFPSFTYTTDGNTDLIAVASDHKKLDTEIKLPFRHLLSQINFGVYEYRGAKITISNIQINGINSKGTFTFKPTDTSIGSWTSATDKNNLQAYSYTFGKNNKFTTTGEATETSYVFGDGGNFAASNSNVKYVYSDGIAYGKEDPKRPAETLSNSLMLLPQTITDFATNDATLTFNYTVTDSKDIVIGENENRKGVIKLDKLNIVWKSNYRYIYMLRFNFDDDKFSFNTDIISWEN